MSTAVATLGTKLYRGAQTEVAFTGEDADDLVDITGHSFSDGDRVRITALTGGSGLSTQIDYYVINANANDFQLALTSGGSAVSFGTDVTAGTIKDLGGAVAQIQDVTGPGLTTDEDEITNHDSTGGVEEFLMTIKRTGEVTFPVVFIPTNATHDDDTGLIQAWSDKSLDGFSLRYPDGSGWDFTAYTKGVSLTAPVGGHLAADITLRPSGEPSFVEGA